jgi:hypothetical protein
LTSQTAPFTAALDAAIGLYVAATSARVRDKMADQVAESLEAPSI